MSASARHHRYSTAHVHREHTYVHVNTPVYAHTHTHTHTKMPLCSRQLCLPFNLNNSTNRRQILSFGPNKQYGVSAPMHSRTQAQHNWIRTALYPCLITAFTSGLTTRMAYQNRIKCCARGRGLSKRNIWSICNYLKKMGESDYRTVERMRGSPSCHNSTA